MYRKENTESSWTVTRAQDGTGNPGALRWERYLLKRNLYEKSHHKNETRRLSTCTRREKMCKNHMLSSCNYSHLPLNTGFFFSCLRFWPRVFPTPLFTTPLNWSMTLAGWRWGWRCERGHRQKKPAMSRRQKGDLWVTGSLSEPHLFS